MTERDVSRELLERRADRLRDRLMADLTALDLKRTELTDVRHQVRAHVLPVALLSGLALLAIGGAIGLSIRHFATRGARRRRERFGALRRAWEHPDRVARRGPPHGSFARELGRKVAMSALTLIAVRLTKRALQRAFPTEQSV